jgi:hypothetical protein
MNPLHEQCEMLGVTLQPSEWVVFRLVALLPWRVSRIGGVLVVVAFKVAGYGFKWFLENGGTADIILTVFP